MAATNATTAAIPLTPEEASRLAEFARACKAAARVVALYPATHPAIQSSLARVTSSATRLRGVPGATGAAAATDGTGDHAASQATSRAKTIKVLPDSVLLDGRAAARADASLTELAMLLHAHAIGELRLHGELGPAAWHALLSLLARAPEDVRADGGVARAWTATGLGGVELRQIDYREVLREREGDEESGWDRIITDYLEGELADLDDASMAKLLEIAGDASRFQAFVDRLITRPADGGGLSRREVVLRLLQSLADFVATHDPTQLQHIVGHIAGVVPRLTPDMVVTLITTGAPRAAGAPPGIDLAGEVRARLTDAHVAEFVARSVGRDHGATARLAQAFQALVPEANDRDRVLALAEQQAGAMPVGQDTDFPTLWKSAAELLTSYSDSPFVSDEYGRELGAARSQAIDVDRMHDYPPERLTGWLATVSEDEVLRLDHQLLLDLLTIETRALAWTPLLETAGRSIEQLARTGQFSLAHRLLEALNRAALADAPFAQSTALEIDRLRAGPVMTHVINGLRQRSDSDVAAVSQFCQALGPSVVAPLADALAAEPGAAVKRLRDVLLGFGAAGRAYAEGLRNSPNPAVRRTAIDLLRAFGGASALPELALLIDDAEPAVQREALRAIAQVGSREAHAMLVEALVAGDAARRDAIMQVLSSLRSDRSASLLVDVLEGLPRHDSFEGTRLAALQALAVTGSDRDAVPVLQKALYGGEWWAPLRTRRRRTAAAQALRANVSSEGRQVLSEAASRGPSGVRRAAQAALQTSPAVATKHSA